MTQSRFACGTPTRLIYGLSVSGHHNNKSTTVFSDHREAFIFLEIGRQKNASYDLIVVLFMRTATIKMFRDYGTDHFEKIPSDDH